MPITATCHNTYLENGKSKKCGEMEPYMDKKTEKVYCSKCDQEIQINHFTKTSMKTLKQFKVKATIPFAIKCQSCNKEDQPKVLNNEIICPHCQQIHQHLSEPFKIILKDKLKNTANKDI